ncbi:MULTISPECIES: OsmC family protein [unclassified Arenibacter]|uniref:OsmC family protein n=1 Tax=unclassified Arenibacter TaxID=2615047 RepID=UPI000E34765C|nr:MULTISPECIES: OsmC family protein [unclassified Arenibacter]MCM4165239.1 osmotically inducible protein OsmC [Arenibacter sp. A80]RFT55094.1 OsmC family peroxiredoxin [Arenibacter sp. P308M17]
MTSKVTYTGNLRTRCEHIRSGNSFITDAPLDNHGLGQAFSPTDTVATGLASCMFSVMGIKARGLELDLENSTAEVIKHMAADPRRISRIDVKFNLPSIISDKHRRILEHTARTCPVHYSLHPDIERNITFQWDL